MTTLSERALEFAVKLNQTLKLIQEYYNGDLPVTARENLLKVRAILKGNLKRIDEIFGVEEL